MAKDPAFLFYYQDFLVGTSFMTNEETGAYIKILCHLADKGEIDKKHMIKICGDQNLFESIKEKFQTNGSGKFFNQRLKEEVLKRKNYSESRKKNRIGKDISLSYDLHMENEDENENINGIKDVVKKEDGQAEVEKLFIRKWSRSYKNLPELMEACNLVKEYGFAKVEDAFHKAGVQNILKVNYVKGILLDKPKGSYGTNKGQNSTRRKDYVTPDETRAEIKNLYEGRTET